MSDGPFKNLKLGKRWQRFAEAVQNVAFDSAECCALASDALVHEILTGDVPALLAKLLAYANRGQLDFDPLFSVESIFIDYSKSAFADNLQKEVAPRLSLETNPGTAIMEAVYASLSEQIRKVRNRIEEECVHDYEVGKMKKDQFVCTLNQASAIFDGLDNNKICEALLSCNKGAFKAAVSKKEGLDEGPKL